MNEPSCEQFQRIRGDGSTVLVARYVRQDDSGENPFTPAGPAATPEQVGKNKNKNRKT